MIASLKPYTAYKDSGVEWLGKVPQHWDVRGLRNLLENVTERDRPDIPLLSVVREKGVIQRDTTSKDENRNFVPDDLRNYKVVRPGQFALNKMKAWQGSYGVSQYSGIVSPAYFVFDISAVEGAFFHSAIRSRAYISFFAQASDGVRIGQWDLSQARMKEIPFFLPPVPEQAAIVRFLDHMDRRIQRYIRAKQKVIKLLEEQKQAIIHRAVTGQIDVRTGQPYPAYKPSGVEWLGDVPEHWEVLTLRRTISRAVDGPHHSPSYLDSGIPFLSARNIKSDRWSLDDAKFISEGDYREFSKRVVPEVGDVLYTKGGTTGVARAVDLTFRFQVWVHVAVLKVKRHKVASDYLALVLNSPRCYEQAQLFTRGATNQDLGLGRMKGIVFALPPLSEQEALLTPLEEGTQAVRTAVDNARQEIDLIREYRTRLIADVVTGKVDVREAAAHLPDQSEEPGPFAEEDFSAGADEDIVDDLDTAPEEADA